MAGQYRFKDDSGNIVAQISASVGGAIAFSGSVVDFTQANNVILGNVQLAGTASNALLLDGFDSQAFAFTSSIHPFTASIAGTNTFTSSATARLNSIETISASNIGRLNSLEAKTGSLASTGSNTFIGTQTITGSLYISSDLIVQGSSSLQNITASAVSIGTNIVNLNTANPAIRYAGLSIGDSGSVGGSGSFLYDSVQDEMIFVHRGANTTVTSSVVLMGPQTYDSIGSETYLTSNRLVKGTGNEHIVDSNISDNGTLVSVNSLITYFSGSVGIGITNPSHALDVNGTGRFIGQAIYSPTLGYVSTSYQSYAGATTWYVGAGNSGVSIQPFVIGRNLNGNSPDFQISSAGAATFASSVNISSTLYASSTATIAYSGLSGDFGAGYTTGLGVGYNSSVAKGINMGWNTALDMGFIGTVHNGTGWKSLMLCPIGGAVYIGATGGSDFYAGSSTFSGIVGVGGATEAGWSLKSNGNLKVANNNGTTVLQLADTSTGGKTWSLISAGASNVHSIAAGTFYLRNSTDSSTPLTITSTGAATFYGGNITSFSAVGVAGFGNGISIHTQPGTYTAGHGGILQFQNEDVITGGIRGIRDGGSWGGSLLFYTHNTSANNTFDSTFVEGMRLTSNGNLLLGTNTDGVYKLDVRAGASNAAKFNFAVTGDWGGGANQDHGMLISGARYTSNTNTSLLHIINTDNTSLLKVTDWGFVGIGTTNPSSTLDINGNVRYRGSIHDQFNYVASGNFTNGTYYNIVGVNQMASGIYVLEGYIDTYTSGGGIYFTRFVSVPFYMYDVGSNSTTFSDLPPVLGTGHHLGNPFPLFRLQQTLAGGGIYLQFNPNSTWAGMNNGSGKTFQVNLKRLGA